MCRSSKARPPPAPQRRPQPKATTAGYDPAAHTVDEVQAYVAAHPDEAAAVLAAEQAGKDRVTLTAALEDNQ